MANNVRHKAVKKPNKLKKYYICYIVAILIILITILLLLLKYLNRSTTSSKLPQSSATQTKEEALQYTLKYINTNPTKEVLLTDKNIISEYIQDFLEEHSEYNIIPSIDSITKETSILYSHFVVSDALQFITKFDLKLYKKHISLKSEYIKRIESSKKNNPVEYLKELMNFMEEAPLEGSLLHIENNVKLRLQSDDEQTEKLDDTILYVLNTIFIGSKEILEYISLNTKTTENIVYLNRSIFIIHLLYGNIKELLKYDKFESRHFIEWWNDKSNKIGFLLLNSHLTVFRKFNYFLLFICFIKSKNSGIKSIVDNCSRIVIVYILKISQETENLKKLGFGEDDKQKREDIIYRLLSLFKDLKLSFNYFEKCLLN